MKDFDEFLAALPLPDEDPEFKHLLEIADPLRERRMMLIVNGRSFQLLVVLLTPREIVIAALLASDTLMMRGA